MGLKSSIASINPIRFGVGVRASLKTAWECATAYMACDVSTGDSRRGGVLQ